MLRRPPRATRPDTLFPDTTLFRSRYSGCYGAPTMLTGLAFPRGVFGGVGIVESIAAPALSPTPPPNGSILNGRRGGGAGRGRLTNQCVSSASLIDQAAGPRMTATNLGRRKRNTGMLMIAGTPA